jgi:hypothetical protein
MYSESDEIETAEVAYRLGISHRHAVSLMRTGALPARQLRSGLWLTTPDTVEAYAEYARRGRGRTLAPASAWAALWELSGETAHWVPESTRFRIRSYLANVTADELIRDVSGRNRVRRYRGDASRMEGPNLTWTARCAIREIDPNRRNDSKAIAAYIRVGSIEVQAELAGMVEDYRGPHALFENTLEITYAPKFMPSAVVAADLARSPNGGDRKVGRDALSRLLEVWRPA